MLIRPATIADTEGIAHVQVDSWRTTYAGMLPDAYLAQLDWRERAAMWRSRLNNETTPTYLYVAETRSGQVVGFAAAGQERSHDPVYTGELYAIYLLQMFQQQGLGRLLLTAVSDRLLQAGHHSMLAWVLKENPNRKFYSAIGGIYLREKQIAIGGQPLLEIAYGWKIGNRQKAPPGGGA